MKDLIKNLYEAIKKAPTIKQPDIDICSECGEHTRFDEDGSECCGAAPINTDPELEDR